MSLVTGILSTIWVTGSLFACILGCKKARSLTKKVKKLEEKFDSLRNPPLIYSIPVRAVSHTPPSPVEVRVPDENE